MLGGYHELQDRWRGPIDKGYYSYGADFIVDFASSPHLQTLYSQLKNLLTSQTTMVQILKAVKDLVRKVYLKRDYEATVEFGEKVTRIKGVASLDDFVRARMGFCAQTALTAAVLLERLVEEKYLQGQVELDAFGLPIPELYINGHQWTVFVNSKGRRDVVDPLYNFVGTEKEYEPVKKRIIDGLFWAST